MKNVLKAIIDKELIKKGETIGVGVSGGSDSMALLHYLSSLQTELDFEVVAIHVDHSLRETSAQDAFFVIDYCKKNKIRAYKFKIDVGRIAEESGQSIETAAREARYGVFESLVKKGIVDKIALAHHMQDQAETILLHILRGSGLAGARGMEWERGVYLRPMLSTHKNEIKNYILSNDIPYVEDETNKDDTYQRNFLRNKVFPLITTRFPTAVESLINFSKTCQEDDDYINSHVLLDALIYEDEKTVKIPISYLLTDTSIASRLIFSALESINVFKDIERKHIEMIQDLAINGENGSKLKLPMNISVYKEYDYITLTNQQKPININSWTFKCGTFNIAGFGKLIVKKARNMTVQSDMIIESESLIIDGKKLPKDAAWRFRKEGDIITKFGGVTQKLKTYLIQKKIPLRQRDNIPVLASNNEIFVVAGVDISEKVKIDENTTNAYVISVLNS
jgi:tRNA(Ile)-lysidine synthase